VPAFLRNEGSISRGAWTMYHTKGLFITNLSANF
jgi:hypothetical protein